MASAVVGALRVLLGLDSAQFEAGVTKAKGSAKDLEGNFSKLGKSFGSAFLPVAGVAAAGFALAAFTKNAFDTASQISDLANQTGLTTDTIQEMGAAADLTGTSLESFTTAAFKLGVNLAGGTERVREAVDALGLSYETLRDQSPDEQFKAIARALYEVEDVQLRNKLAVELFGRGAKEILPAIAQNFDKIGDAAVKAGKAQIGAVDEAGDALTRFWRGLKSLAIEVFGTIVLVGEKAWGALGTAANALFFDKVKDGFQTLQVLFPKVFGGNELPKVFKEAATAAGLLPAPIKAISMSLDEQNKIEKELTKSVQDKIKKTVEGIDKMAEAAERFRESISYFNTADNLGTTFVKPISDAASKLAILEATMAPLAASTDIASNAFEEFKKAVKESGTEAAKFATHTKAAFEDLGQTILQAIKGGGNVLASIGSSIGLGLGEDLKKGLLKSIGEGGGILQTLTRGLASALPGLGALLGPAISGLWGGIKKLFGFGNDETKKRAEEAAAAAKKAAEDALAALQAQIDGTKAKIEGFKSDLDGLIAKGLELGYQFDAQGNLVGVSFEKMAAAAEAFGIDINALGPAFQQQQIDAEAGKIINAFELMVKGGADVGTVLVGMKDEISKVVQDSLQFGTTIPEQMRPWIANLIETGQLLDENGMAITDISQLKFAPPIVTEFEKIQTAILEIVNKPNEAVNALMQMTAAINNIPTHRSVTIDTYHNDHYSEDTSGGGADYGGAQAKGGEYFVNKPTWFLAGEAGPEFASFSGAMNSAAGFNPASALPGMSMSAGSSGGSSGMTDAGIIGAIHGLKREMREITQAVRIGVQEAVLQS